MSQIKLPHKKHLRADAAWVLYQILELGKSSRECLPLAQARHSAQDSAWLQEMVMGVLRQLPLLQTWLRERLDKPLKGNKKIIEHLLLIGMYQLKFTRVSEHAAINETVNGTAPLGGAALKGLVNGILRNVQRESFDIQSLDPIIASGMPKWLFKQLANAYPNDIDSIIANTNAIAPIWLRVNRRKCSLSQFTEALDKHQLRYKLTASHPDAVILESRLDVTAIPGFEEGWFAVQDGAAQLAAPYLAPQPKDRILDCCAAPGGKTGHILELQPELSTCVAVDADHLRLERVSENMKRLGHQPIILQGDASLPNTWWDGEHFDRILLDAPCSATGVIRRHPDIRWLRKRADIDNLTELQSKILDSLWPTLKPGGVMLYATCSILPSENALQIASFLSRTPDAKLDPIAPSETTQFPGRQILPGESQMDGFYYARLIKSQ